MKREKAKKESATKETMADEASPVEQMYGAIMAVKDLLDSPEHTSGPVVHGTGDLGEENVKRLLAIGCLKEVLDGWYIIRFTPEDCGPADWCRAYWHFIVAYLNDKFGEDWCLSPDCSLDFYSESTLIPDQLVVRSGKAGGKIVRLPYDSSILEVKADVPEDVEKDPKYGVHLYPLHVALLAASKDYYKTHPVEARVCLRLPGHADQHGPGQRCGPEDGIPETGAAGCVRPASHRPGRNGGFHHRYAARGGLRN